MSCIMFSINLVFFSYFTTGQRMKANWINHIGIDLILNKHYWKNKYNFEISITFKGQMDVVSLYEERLFCMHQIIT